MELREKNKLDRKKKVFAIKKNALSNESFNCELFSMKI